MQLIKPAVYQDRDGGEWVKLDDLVQIIGRSREVIVEMLRDTARARAGKRRLSLRDQGTQTYLGMTEAQFLMSRYAIGRPAGGRSL